MPLVELDDPELREELARSAYYQERYFDMLGDQERSELDDARYFCLDWDSLSDFARRPFRLGVDAALNHVKEMMPA